MVKAGVEATCTCSLLHMKDPSVVRDAIATMRKVLFGKTIYVVCANNNQARDFQRSLGLKVYFIDSEEVLIGRERMTIVFLTSTKYKSRMRQSVDIYVRNAEIWYIGE
jgi:hypothetical protein